MKQYLKIIGIMAVLANLLGCVTMQDSSEVTQQQEDMLLLKEDLNRTKGKLETLEMEYQRLLRELDAMQGAAASSKGATSSTQVRIDELERRLSVLEGARAKDRQAIVDQLSGKMVDIMGDRTTGKSSQKSKSAATKASATGMTGYEHVVKEGDTLSAIATAYKVKIDAIAEANKLQSPYTLRTGQKLFIPQP
ncbi:MAG: LysM peptidoglycan-binding domain-containing protein [Verrucomicrobia bacterium]|nr:LysM peptidoglycan-binding domain-containing protein [Verrucomicrobiota bacterium]MBU1735645.1 LysM peptidoglycan-binding domain-containing protein [Verrucomicrobiota bacterium]MBU1856691.1 LysM peptidoglycan-binding domain-containing protein [Verrucomicrobiota bacterium]